MRIDDFVGAVIGLFLSALLIAVSVGLLSLGVDAYKERQAFAAITACEAKQSIPHRKYMSTTVVCIPSIVRQDTTTVRITK